MLLARAARPLARACALSSTPTFTLHAFTDGNDFGFGRGAQFCMLNLRHDALFAAAQDPAALYAEKYAGWLPFSRFSAWAAIKMAHSFADLTLVTSPQIMAQFKEQKIKRVGVWRKGVDVDAAPPDAHGLQHCRRRVRRGRGAPWRLARGRENTREHRQVQVTAHVAG